jgi:endonuclease G
LLGTTVPLPIPRDGAVPTVRLDYVHFSVLMRPDRRLAAVTGVGIDGALLRDLDRDGIDWRLDDRLTADAQAGPELYANNDLDRGHLVRRADAVWGDNVAEAQAGNVDTFHYTNAAPQAAQFNQGNQLWLGLETYLLIITGRAGAKGSLRDGSETTVVTAAQPFDLAPVVAA